MRRVVTLLLCLLLCGLAAAPGALADLDPPFRSLILRLSGDGFDEAALTELYLRPEMRFDPKVMAKKMNSLVTVRLREKGAAPPEPELHEQYLNPVMLAGAYAYLREHRSDLARAAAFSGVPEDILVALLLVETKLGMTLGKDSAFFILSNMSAGRDVDLIRPWIEPQDLPEDLWRWLKKRTTEKGDWAYKELTALLRYAQQAGADPLSIPGSSYGAIGICQFMPSNAFIFGKDGDADGRVDLFNEADAYFSVGNFLKRHGWKPNMAEADQAAVIYRYNHSRPYARTILAVARELRKIDAAFR